eukprot:6179824-Pleurochrysis_carterae.AAC.1
MLQNGVQSDVPNFRSVVVLEEELCQPVVWMTNTARMPFRLVLPKGDFFRLNLHLGRQEMTKSNRSVAQRVLTIVAGGTTYERHQYGTPLRRGTTSRCASARYVLRGFVSKTE